MKLSELKTGEKASIVKVLGHGGFRKRILEMGFVKGKVVFSVLNAPLNDPIKYRIMDYEVSLRRSEAELIEVVTGDELENISFDTNTFNETSHLEGNLRKGALIKRKEILVALVGNPNCGKTTLFNQLSGSKEHVGNYSGVTVDAKESKFNFEGYVVSIVDLPGTYSLTAYTPEERFVRGFIIDRMPDVVINVVDSTNLERNLYLTTQLIEMNIRTVVALNMYDEFQQRGDELNHAQLGKLLGLPFVPTIGKKKWGIYDLFKTVVKLYESSEGVDSVGNLLPSINDDSLIDQYHHDSQIHHSHSAPSQLNDLQSESLVHNIARHIHIFHGSELEKSINKLKSSIGNDNPLIGRYSKRYLAVKLLENDEEIEKLIHNLPDGEMILSIRNKVSRTFLKENDEDIESAICDAKYGFISGALKETYILKNPSNKSSRTTIIDNIVTNKYLGYPLFVLFIYIMFQSTFTLGKYPMKWIDFGITSLGQVVASIMDEGSLRDLVVNGIIGGVGGVIVFLPNILILFLFISIMEDTGYMSRAAFIMDKVMHKMGLHGKSFIPLIMGFGCNVPAIMATRTIENRNNRMVTILINPLISCSARLPVYLLLAGTFFPEHAGVILFAVYGIGVGLAVLIARLLKKTLFSKDESPFVMELPPYRLPSAKSIILHTWEKGEQYLRKMATIILVGSIVVWFLGYFPRSNPSEMNVSTPSSHLHQIENSYIGKIGHFVEPVIKPLGFDWKVGVALMSGIAAKEIVVSTIGVLYSSDRYDKGKSLAERIKSEVRLDGSPSITPVAAFGLMVFVLIYFPCLATIVAIKNETQSWTWAMFAVVYSLILAWIMAFLIHQIFT